MDAPEKVNILLVVSELRYIQASGRHDGGEDRLAGKAEAHALAEQAVTRLATLVARYQNPEMPYEVKRRRGPFATAYRYDEYEHLARIKEWLTQDIEEDFG